MFASHFQYTGKQFWKCRTRLKNLPARENVALFAATRESGSWFAAALAAFPRGPAAQQLQLLVEGGFFDEDVEFRAGKPLAERLAAVGDSPGRKRGQRGVQLQLTDIHLVHGVRSGV